MSVKLMAGTRIRERRLLLGMKQSDLARLAGVSASYLNLIEHNRRRIGGKTLLKLAEALEVEPTLLSDGVGRRLVDGLHGAAGRHKEFSAEVERVEEFAARFPGWAELLNRLSHEREELIQTVTSLTDRMAHDPQLAGSLHEVISTVTAIHSAASILVETKELEPEWQGRFHRNINEDSQRLAEGAEALVRYLEGAPETGRDIRSPYDEMHAFLEKRGYHFPELENDSEGGDVAALLDDARTVCSPGSVILLQDLLMTYVADAQALPMSDVEQLISQGAWTPERIATTYKMTLPQVFRRLAMLPTDLVGPVGLLVSDVTGAVLFRKPLDGFSLPRSGDGCALWPIYQVLSAPQTPVSVTLRQIGMDSERVQALAVSEQIEPASFSTAAVTKAYMLLLPDMDPGGAQTARDVGLNCSICGISQCKARREPSILTKAF
ncbi:transcriptional repressor DicA [Roseovarius albus]|uniref:Transcriptional repressor DicA n=1 Tax=Roseovarius albus TaxID=1247867 RepID=A0A1X6ZK63_9RHOB|nr:helix-turn-helix transcriptional regulator [Roseovarius albus]SLN51758.1 transcriptional repressor DicA [Roseovarius albus]